MKVVQDAVFNTNRTVNKTSMLNEKIPDMFSLFCIKNSRNA